jgi:hypothetical protein
MRWSRIFGEFDNGDLIVKIRRSSGEGWRRRMRRGRRLCGKRETNGRKKERNVERKDGRMEGRLGGRKGGREKKNKNLRNRSKPVSWWVGNLLISIIIRISF